MSLTLIKVACQDEAHNRTALSILRSQLQAQSALLAQMKQMEAEFMKLHEETVNKLAFEQAQRHEIETTVRACFRSIGGHWLRFALARALDGRLQQAVQVSPLFAKLEDAT